MDKNWRERERARFVSGEYTPVPWVHDIHYIPILDHFAHVSQNDPALLAYTPNESYGERDRQSSIRPGRYLSKYYPRFSGPVRSSFVAKWRGGEIPLYIAVTREEIARVYQTGPSSCMSGAWEQFPCHPVEAYAAGDVGVAYITDGKEKTDCVSARTIVKLDDSVALPPRYGDYLLLEEVLRRHGYRLGTNTDFAGTRLLKLEYGTGTYIVPFVDFGYTGWVGEEYIYVSGKRPSCVEVGAECVSLDSTAGLVGNVEWCGECEAVLRAGESETGYCDDCLEYLIFCTRCGERLEPTWDFCMESPSTGNCYCHHCYTTNWVTCSMCDEPFLDPSECNAEGLCDGCQGPEEEE